VGYKATCLLAVLFLWVFPLAAEGQEKTEAQKPWPPEVQIIKAEGSTVVIMSGVGPVDMNGELVATGDFRGQFHQTWENVRRLAAGTGTPLGNIVSITVYLKDGTLQDRFTELQGETFGSWAPATTFSVTGNLGTPGALLEIHAVAINVEQGIQRRN